MNIKTKFDIGDKVFALLYCKHSKKWILIKRKVKILRITINSSKEVRYQTEYIYRAVDKEKPEFVDKRILTTDPEQDLFRTAAEAKVERRLRIQNQGEGND